MRLGKLKVTDPDENDSHVFLLSDKRFEVINDELRLAAGAHFDFETESKVILRVTAIDQANASTSSSTTISIGDVNESPTAIAIDTDSVFEELIGQRIGVLAVSDEDVGQTHSLVSLDERFEIVGNELRQKPLQSIPRDSGEITDVRVKVTDSGNPVLSAELTLQLRVIEVVELNRGTRR